MEDEPRVTPRPAHTPRPARTMVDKGPLLTSAIIFYLSIGAAIFQVLEEPNWNQAVKEYTRQKEKILEAYPCLTQHDLDRILEVSRCLLTGAGLNSSTRLLLDFDGDCSVNSSGGGVAALSLLPCNLSANMNVVTTCESTKLGDGEL